MTTNSIVLFWFRRDLRIEDNVGLFHALNSGKKVLPVFIFDENILNKLSDKTDKRVDFIHQVLTSINKKLIQSQSGLKVYFGKPLAVFKKIIALHTISEVYTNNDYEPSALQRDKEVESFFKSKGIKLNSFKDQVIFEKNEILKANGEPYTVFTPFANCWKQTLRSKPFIFYPSELHLNQLLKMDAAPIPTLNEIGFQKSGIEFSEPQVNTTIILNYHETRNIPSIEGTTQLSVHLRFGTISIRKLVNIALNTNEQWLNELIWREFFMVILYYFPRVVDECFKLKYESIVWRNNEDEFKRWCEGKTGYPIVDAGMRELNETGFMHNRVRMVVASFLTKHLLIDWRWGEAYFSKKLMDYDLSANNGNWQWSAGCGCDAAPYFRIFNPYEQAKKFDPKGIYIQKWVKEYNTLNYSLPIVNHEFARERVLKVYKTALQEVD